MNTHIYESDITKKFGDSLEKLPDYKFREIKEWIRFHKDKLKKDRAAWFARGGRYKDPELHKEDNPAFGLM